MKKFAEDGEGWISRGKPEWGVAMGPGVEKWIITSKLRADQPFRQGYALIKTPGTIGSPPYYWSDKLWKWSGHK
jgi:hypothetical protein